MSWDIFKQNVLNMANNPKSITELSVAAHKYATEYDACMKRGFNPDLLVSVQKGNVEIMESLFLSAFQLGLTQPGLYDIVGQLGKGVIAYWGGAELSHITVTGTIPLPTVEQLSQGVAYNVQTYSIFCSNAGTWPDFYSLPPTNPTTNIIDLFILSAQMHLTTLSGVGFFASYYPASLVGTLPSFPNWVSYTIGPPPITPKANVSTPDIEEWIQERPKNLKETADTTTYGVDDLLSGIDEVVDDYYNASGLGSGNPNGYKKPPTGTYGTDITSVTATGGTITAYGGYNGKAVDSSYYIKNNYIPALERVHFDKSNGIRLLMQAQTQLEGFYPNSASWRTNNPGNVYPTRNGKTDKTGFKTLDEGVDAQWKYVIGPIFKGTSKYYKKEMGLYQYLSVYAPVSDGNNPTEYTNFIIGYFKKKGVTINANTTLLEISNIK
jgi:hypothetical protein